MSYNKNYETYRSHLVVGTVRLVDLTYNITIC